MKFITFQKPNLNHLFIIAYFATIIFKEILAEIIFEEKLITALFFQTYFTYLSSVLSIIPFLIIKWRSRKRDESSDISSKKSAINLIFIDRINKYKGKNLYKYTFLASLFDFLSEAILCVFFFIYNSPELYSSYSLNIYMIINCVILYIMSYYILKTNFYKHHYLSFLINFICFLIAFIIDIVEITKQEITDYRYYIYIFVRIIRLTFYSILDSYAKLAMYSSFLSPYSLLLYMSLYEIVFLIIFSIPFIFITVEDFDGSKEIIFKQFLKYLTGTKLVYTILIFINAFLTELFLMYIIDRFSPSHLALAILLKPFFKNIYNIFKYMIKGEKVYWNQYANFFIFLLVIIGSMVHNEILIINKWGLNKKTKLFLNKEFNDESSDDEFIDNIYTINDFDENDEKKEDDHIELIKT